MSTLRAATYARYSSDNQRDTSPEDQRRNCHARAAREGWRIVADFTDKAISGSTTARPQYLTMQEQAKAGAFDVLIIDDLSRLARDSVETELVLRRLEFQGIRVVSCGDGYDSASKSRKVQRGVRGLMNEIFIDDLREKVERGQRGQALKGRWLGGRPFGFKLKAITDASRTDAYGNPERIGTMLEVNPEQAKIVKEIFTRFADGESYLMIAKSLNMRGVPSPGSTWKRKTRRCASWMASSVRVIIKNRLYCGTQTWARFRIVKDPDTGRKVNQPRPGEQVVVNQIESLRIISNEQYERAQRRTRARRDSSEHLKSGGKAKYLLSGLLICGKCGSNMTMRDIRSYQCGGYIGGRACDHETRVKRLDLEDTILGPVRRELFSPERVAHMGKMIEQGHAARLAAASRRADTAPAELVELDARLARLRARLAAGDPDMPPDELQAAIARAQAKRDELAAAQPAAKATAKIISMLPRAASMYIKMIEQGLAGDARAAAKARVLLRETVAPITISTDAKGRAWAAYKLNPAALIRAAGTDGGAGGN